MLINHSGLPTSDTGEIRIEDRSYVSAKDAARRYHYHPDYLGQLCRGQKLLGIRIGRNWFIERSSLEAFAGAMSSPTPPAGGEVPAAPTKLVGRIRRLFQPRKERIENPRTDPRKS